MCKRLALSLFFIALATSGASAQGGSKSQTRDTRPSPTSVSDEVLRQLLSMPAPPPRGSESGDDESAKKTRAPKFLDELKRPVGDVPADDAPDEEILAYWELWSLMPRRQRGDPPTDAVKSRILAACEAKPERLPRLLSLLPDTPDAAERVKKLYDASLSSTTPDPTWQKYVHDWLRLNSNYFLSELLNEARTVRDKSGYVDGEGELSALAKVDWDSAERSVQDNVQSAIATTAGPLDIGQSASWQVPEKLPFSGRSGTAEVARAFGSAIPCKDVIFTVAGDHGVYTTTVCRNDEGAWTWAAAEPSIHRWGYLQ